MERRPRWLGMTAGAPQARDIRVEGVQVGSGGGGGGGGGSPLYDLLAQQARLRDQLAKKQLELMKQELKIGESREKMAHREARRDRSQQRTPGVTPRMEEMQFAQQLREQAEHRARAEERGRAGTFARAMASAPGRAHGLKSPHEVQNLTDIVSAIGMPAAHQGLMQSGKLLAGQGGGGLYSQEAPEEESPYDFSDLGPARLPLPWAKSSLTYNPGLADAGRVEEFRRSRGRGSGGGTFTSSDLLGSNEVGTLPGTVPKTGPYELHKGEIVLEADQVDESLLDALIGDKLRKMQSGQIQPKGKKKDSYESGTLLGSYQEGSLENPRLVDRVRRLGGLNVSPEFNAEYEGSGLKPSRLRRRKGGGISADRMIQSLREEGYVLPDDITESGLYERLGASYDAKMTGRPDPGIAGTGDQFYDEIERLRAEYEGGRIPDDEIANRGARRTTTAGGGRATQRTLPLGGAGSIDDVLQGSGLSGEDVAKVKAWQASGRGGSKAVGSSADDVAKIIARESGIPEAVARNLPMKVLAGLGLAMGVVYGVSKLVGGDEPASEVSPARGEIPENPEIMGPPDELAGGGGGLTLGDPENSALMRMIGSMTGSYDGPVLNRGGEPNYELGPEPRYLGLGGGGSGDERLGGDVEAFKGYLADPPEARWLQGKLGGAVETEKAPPTNYPDMLNAAAAPGYKPPETTDPPLGYEQQLASVLERAQAGRAAIDAGETEGFGPEPFKLHGSTDPDSPDYVPAGTINDPEWRANQDRQTMSRANRSKASQIAGYLATQGNNIDAPTFTILRDEVKRLEDVATMIDKQEHQREALSEKLDVEVQKAYTRYQGELVKAQARQDGTNRNQLMMAKRSFQSQIWKFEEGIFDSIEKGDASPEQIEAMARQLAQYQFGYDEGESEEELDAMENYEVGRFLGMMGISYEPPEEG